MIRPVLDRLIVQQDEPVTTTSGGLHIPETAQVRNMTVTVLAIGPDVKDVKVGDRLVLHPDCGWDLYLEDRDGPSRTMMVEHKDIIGVCE